MKDYYSILGVNKYSSPDSIKRAYRKLALKYHPDKSNGDTLKFQEIAEAYDVLSNSDKKYKYDNKQQYTEPFSFRTANDLFNNFFQLHNSFDDIF